jgi:hypothetical protein
MLKKKINKKLSIYLTLAGPIIMLIYLTLDHYGVIDKWIKQDKLEIAINRLESTSGFPISWLYNDSIDGEFTKPLFKLIKENSKLLVLNYNSKEIFKSILKDNYPILITTGGSPIKIENVTETWEQKDKYFYSENHPVLIVFNARRHVDGDSFGGKVCTIGEVKKWAEQRKMRVLYWIGGIGIGLLSIAITILQFRIE